MCLRQVASFQCLQPFVGTLLAFAVLGEEPSVWDLGAIGVLVGLVLVVSDKHNLQASLRMPLNDKPDQCILITCKNANVFNLEAQQWARSLNLAWCIIAEWHALSLQCICHFGFKASGIVCKPVPCKQALRRWCTACSTTARSDGTLRHPCASGLCGAGGQPATRVEPADAGAEGGACRSRRSVL